MEEILTSCKVERNTAYVEVKFPIEKLSFLARREKQSIKPIYQLHTWFARRSGAVFRGLILGAFLSSEIREQEFWKYFYSNTDLNRPIVLDPFMGGGTTVVEALKLNCRPIGVDLNPVAWFVSKKEIEPFDRTEFDETLRVLERQVSTDLKKWYVTKCPTCEKDADLVYAYWVKTVSCESCGGEIPLFQYYALAKIANRSWLYCPMCEDVRVVSAKQDILSKPVCPSCKTRLVPSSTGRTYICRCGHVGKVLDAVRSSAKQPESRLFALEYFCSHCKARGCKKAEDLDRKLYLMASDEFQKLKHELPLPTQVIGYGEESSRVLNYGYRNFEDLFNDRQKLCLSMLLKSITKLDKRCMEYMLLAFSNCLEFNNVLVSYVYSANKVESCFSFHEYLHAQAYVENNVWGVQYGRGTFTKCCRRVREGKSYCLNPYERLYRKTEKAILSAKMPVSRPIEAHVYQSFRDFKKARGDALLRCQSSVDLSFLPDRSVDAVITDPPYYDNLIYSGLSDLYYSWLSIHLGKRYGCFRYGQTPKAEEIVVNRLQPEKNQEAYLGGLTDVFRECSRVLKKKGLMIFTFHHTKARAWSTVLQAVLDAGFYVVAGWPVHSEARTYRNVKGRKTVRYDVALVCRKRLNDGKEIEWIELKNQIEKKAGEIMRRFLKTVPISTEQDAFTIMVGKLLQLYSCHYPKVMKEGNVLSVQEAISEIENASLPFAEKWVKSEEPSKAEDPPIFLSRRSLHDLKRGW